jgi:hypothetical protein
LQLDVSVDSLNSGVILSQQYYSEFGREAAMAKRRLKILDSDMHLMEPVDLWELHGSTI